MDHLKQKTLSFVVQKHPSVPDGSRFTTPWKLSATSHLLRQGKALGWVVRSEDVFEDSLKGACTCESLFDDGVLAKIERGSVPCRLFLYGRPMALRMSPSWLTP